MFLSVRACDADVWVLVVVEGMEIWVAENEDKSRDLVGNFALFLTGPIGQTRDSMRRITMSITSGTDESDNERSNQLRLFIPS